MDQIDDEDVDEELERLKTKLDRLQSETPEETEQPSTTQTDTSSSMTIRFIEPCPSASSSLPLVYASSMAQLRDLV